MLAAKLLPSPHTELSANDAPNDQEEGEKDIQGVVERGVEQRDDSRDEDNLEDRSAHNNVGWHAQDVDHGWNHNEAAANAKKRGEKPDEATDNQGRDRADIEPRSWETHLEGQAVNPIVLTRLPGGNGLASALTPHRVDALPQHQRTEGAKKQHVSKRDYQPRLSNDAQLTQ